MSTTIKKANQKYKYTPEQRDELIKCRDDALYFIETYVKIIDGEAGNPIQFKPYPYQKNLLESLINNKQTIALFPRQSGKTEAVCAFLIWYATFQKNRNILVAAHKFEHVQEVLRRIKIIYELLPDWIKPGVTKDGYNARSIKFENGSIITGTATTENSGRGRTINFLYIDEFAFVEPRLSKEFWASVRPTLSSSNGSCAITSTPSADDDEFAQLWFGAKDTLDEHGIERPTGLGRNGFKAVFAEWSEKPGRNENWKKQELEAIGEERFRREHQCEFISFEITLINPIWVAEKLNKMGVDPLFLTGQVRWYGPILPNKKYVLALDPSMGTGADNAAIQILQLPEMIQIGEWKHNKTPIQTQIKILQSILNYIHETMTQKGDSSPNIYWSVENNSLGEAALIAINELGEENFKGYMISESKQNRGRSFRKGFNTTSKKKLESCAKFKNLLETGKLRINSKSLIREIKFFVASGAGYCAKVGETDDLIMSMLLCIRILQELYNWDEDVQDAFQSEADGILMPMPTLLL